ASEWRGNPRTHERQYLPLLGLSQYRRGHHGSAAREHGMRAFTYERPDTIAAASQAASQPDAAFIAGGTNLLDLMKVEVERPTHLVDVSRLPLRNVIETPDGGLHIGALVSNTDVAADSRVRQHYPVLAQALVNGASA